jgi:TetR/AcrR family transcriptional repressor of mexJK operon
MTPATRPRTVRKRAAVLDAAQALFVVDGYERTSLDAVAARAGVSKRTVYDYFGDKDGVLTAVVGGLSRGLADTVNAAVDAERASGEDIRATLLAFVRRVATRTFASSEYRLLRQLLIAGGPATRRQIDHLDDLLETLLAQWFTELADRGLLRAPNPYRAGQHFIALTFLLASDTLRDATTEADDDTVDDILVDGVEAFLRAYTG